MDTVANATKNAIHHTVRFINQPFVKEGVKNVAGSVTFVFGLVELYDIYQILRGREISTEPHSNQPQWMQVANKVVIVSAKISLILSATTSRPGVFLISIAVGSLFSPVQLERVFGPNTIFALNPWHPRHVISIAAVILALPAVAQSLYNGAVWAHHKVCHHDPSETWLTDAKVRMMALFNTITSRPVLHSANQLARSIF